ncbi:hypothetical protein [Actinokineospora terrae]|uniref:Uncharacterized protein n=1 Tax=Actinokineospora terrae TaxID=155974 RepID=A0A1H9UQU1_9PSEU|nr:hypothetical protein [Actinokineospora terrae]SES11393.1 hypothetical protein SAMN04487818_107394 [Actinokineospora terrae]
MSGSQQESGYVLDEDTTELFWGMLEDEGVHRAGFVAHMSMCFHEETAATASGGEG